MHIERFAPSPTGPLHLGHAYSAWLAHRRARLAGGRFLLRLEDLDASRVRPEWAALIEEDLRWLGLDWDGPVLCQSTRAAAYQSALEHLHGLGLVYTCTCTRRDILEATSAPQEGAAPVFGPDGVVYPGTCRASHHPVGPDTALRLDMAAALEVLAARPQQSANGFEETGAGPDGETGWIEIGRDALLLGVGDIVLSRRDGAPAYHLAVVVDDAWQGVTHVTRGQDLFSATAIHRVLQILLNLPSPRYHHHRLVRDENGKRLAKRDDARAIRTYREEGLAPEEVLARAGVSDPPDR